MRSLVTVIGSITSIAFRRGRGKIRMESGKFAGGGDGQNVVEVELDGGGLKHAEAHEVLVDRGLCVVDLLAHKVIAYSGESAVFIDLDLHAVLENIILHTELEPFAEVGGDIKGL